MSTKLTKKQKKAAQFKKRKGGKALDNVLDVPILDNPDADDGFGQDPEAAIMAGTSKPVQSKKRKREEENDEEDTVSKKKVKPSEETVEDEEKPKVKKPKAPPKYILFVGNLSYKTTEEDIAAHFSSCDPKPTIRMLTSRNKTPDPSRPEKSKGCVFLEFSKASGLQTALRLHHSELNGRQINVELSAGGGGKSDQRMKKVKDKNAKLEKHRTESSINRKKSTTQGTDNLADSLAKPRHSTTSGSKVEPNSRKTWTIPRDGEAPGRGGQRHRKSINGRGRPNNKGPRQDRGWVMSGANAIPVG